MVTDAAIAEEAQKLNADTPVELFILDALALGGSIYRFTNSSNGVDDVVFDGNHYTPIPVESKGWEWSGTGALPRPKVKIASNAVIKAAVITYGDLIGAKLTRLETMEKFLDGQPDADNTAHWPVDIYNVERKISHNKAFIEWELSAAMDQQGRQLPGRQALKNACTHIYRKHDALSTDFFDYTRATCPYVGDSYFTVNGVSTLNASDDLCGKRLSDCRLRFGEFGVLPTRAFPGIARF